ncbi:MAG TPA: ricin-type beta-trefoil lectin domain protein [Streptosporangiaceae bacterium]|nr:ricin-type beta-trefoil lectin domain protein [Streptosporangiaceae bacterium]
MLSVKTCLTTAVLVVGAGLAAPAAPAMATATGYCLDSGGDRSQRKVPAYLWHDCSDRSANLRWVIRNGQIRNVATGYCLDSGGDNSQRKVPAYLWYDCSNTSSNLKWVVQNGQIKNM